MRALLHLPLSWLPRLPAGTLLALPLGFLGWDGLGACFSWMKPSPDPSSPPQIPIKGSKYFLLLDKANRRGLPRELNLRFLPLLSLGPEPWPRDLLDHSASQTTRKPQGHC
jgi:hypothetical protein